MSEKEVKFGFTGTRNGMTEYQKEKIHELLSSYSDKKIVIFHGDCIGADTDFHNICREYSNIRIEIFPPDDKKCRSFCDGNIIHKEKPDVERNKEIVNNSDTLIACPFDKNKEILRSGTWSTIRYARKIKKNIILI